MNQMFDGSSQIPTTAECVVIKSLSTIQTREQCSAEVGSKEEPRKISLRIVKNAFVVWAFNFGVRLSLKGAVNYPYLLKKRPNPRKRRVHLQGRENGERETTKRDVKSELINTTRAWDKAKSESSAGIEPVTTRTLGWRSIHWGTRTRGVKIKVI